MRLLHDRAGLLQSASGIRTDAQEDGEISAQRVDLRAERAAFCHSMISPLSEANHTG
jgi:hypothetical protein